MGIATVFVHLGTNPSPQLANMARAAIAANPETKNYLITDHIETWNEFPGTLVNYSKEHRSKFIDILSRKNKEMEEIAGGYWFYTFERIFALSAIYSVLGKEDSFLHYESDVLPMILSSDEELFKNKTSMVAIPRYSEERGIASILYSPNKFELEKLLDHLRLLIMSKQSPINDMDLLGRALNLGILDELPTLPSKAWVDNKGNYVVFDGAAFGQYLFGQDPFHTNNRRISGFINPDYKLDISSWKWKLNKENDRYNTLEFATNLGKFRVLNLHIHSKIILSEPNFNGLWVQALEEANGERVRVAGEEVQNHIHSGHISILNRFRLAKKRGLFPTILRLIKKSLRHIISQHKRTL